MHKVILSGNAHQDLAKTVRRYEDISTNLANRFLDDFDVAIDRLEQNPNLCSIYEDHFRFVKLKNFPYVLIFRFIPDALEVLTVKHSSQNDDFWRERITSS
jgi:Plasmid stabilization system protein